MEPDFTFMMIFGAAIAGGLTIAKWIYHCIMKWHFSEQYGTGRLPRSIKVRKRRHREEFNHYVLNYPYWFVSKKDGTADKRVKKNFIIWLRSELYVEDYLVFSKRPYDLIAAVERLRLQGVDIALCDEEKTKSAGLLKKKAAFAHNADIQKLIDYFADKPTQFEGLCSELLKSLGFSVTVTPPVNDGGYDLLLVWGSEKTIVECKCYSTAHKVGRPSIQKLVGANTVIMADRMLLITTSDFSAAAVSYAKEAGVDLMNGHGLMTLLDKQGFFEKKKAELGVMECQLHVSDLYPYVPDDIYERFFV